MNFPVTQVKHVVAVPEQVAHGEVHVSEQAPGNEAAPLPAGQAVHVVAAAPVHAAQVASQFVSHADPTRAGATL